MIQAVLEATPMVKLEADTGLYGLFPHGSTAILYLAENRHILHEKGRAVIYFNVTYNISQFWVVNV